MIRKTDGLVKCFWNNSGTTDRTLTSAEVELQRPAPVGFDNFVDLTHDANGLVQSNGNSLTAKYFLTPNFFSTFALQSSLKKITMSSVVIPVPKAFKRRCNE